MTAAEFWVSALRLTLGFTQCREKEGSYVHLLILPATSWDRVSRDYLRAPILRFSEQERITGAELRAPSLRQRYRVSRPRALIALFALAKLWINILILHAACFYSNLATTFLERVFTATAEFCSGCLKMMENWTWAPFTSRVHSSELNDLGTEATCETEWGACLRQNYDIWTRVSSSNILMARPAHS